MLYTIGQHSFPLLMRTHHDKGSMPCLMLFVVGRRRLPDAHYLRICFLLLVDTDVAFQGAHTPYLMRTSLC